MIIQLMVFLSCIISNGLLITGEMYLMRFKPALTVYLSGQPIAPVHQYQDSQRDIWKVAEVPCGILESVPYDETKVIVPSNKSGRQCIDDQTVVKHGLYIYNPGKGLVFVACPPGYQVAEVNGVVSLESTLTKGTYEFGGQKFTPVSRKNWVESSCEFFGSCLKENPFAQTVGWFGSCGSSAALMWVARRSLLNYPFPNYTFLASTLALGFLSSGIAKASYKPDEFGKHLRWACGLGLLIGFAFAGQNNQ